MLYKGLQLLYINQSFNQALVAYLQCSYIITDLVIDHFNSYIKHQRDTHPVDRWMNITTNQSFRAMMHWCIVSASTNTQQIYKFYFQKTHWNEKIYELHIQWPAEIKPAKQGIGTVIYFIHKSKNWESELTVRSMIAFEWKDLSQRCQLYKSL